MKRRFMLFSFFVMAVIVSFLLFANTGSAYSIPNAYFTDGLTGWTKTSGWGTASVIENGAPNGENSVRLTLGSSDPYVLLTSTKFWMDTGETTSGWFKTETAGKWVEVYLDRLAQSGDIRFSSGTSQTWESWNLTAWADGYYTLNFSVAPGSSGQFANAPVPIPPTVWLLGSGLIGLVGLRRRFMAFLKK